MEENMQKEVLKEGLSAINGLMHKKPYHVKSCRLCNFAN